MPDSWLPRLNSHVWPRTEARDGRSPTEGTLQTRGEPYGSSWLIRSYPGSEVPDGSSGRRPRMPSLR
jgi:hypothetical protein